MIICLTAAACAAVTLVPPASAQAAGQGRVSIGKIGTKTAKYKGTVTVSPVVRSTGPVKVESKRMTIRKGKKVVKSNARSARLRAGAYRVTTNVTFRRYSNVTRTETVVPAGRKVFTRESYVEYAGLRHEKDSAWLSDCWIKGIDAVDEGLPEATDVLRGYCDVVNRDWERIGRIPFGDGVNDIRYRWAQEQFADYKCLEINGVRNTWVDYCYAWKPRVGDAINMSYLTDDPFLRASTGITRRTSTRKYGRVQTVSRTQSLKVKAGKKPRTCATKADYRKLAFGQTKTQVAKILHSKGTYSDIGDSYRDYVNEYRDYRVCKKNTNIEVGFEDGRLFHKRYYSF